jgi:hypothetical protein
MITLLILAALILFIPMYGGFFGWFCIGWTRRDHIYPFNWRIFFGTPHFYFNWLEHNYPYWYLGSDEKRSDQDV